MSDYLRRRFPLGDTSAVYMDGTSCYQLVSHDRPGAIATVVMRPEQAEMFRQAIGRAMADAWDEGHRASERDWEMAYDLSTPDEDRQPWTNPYRQESGRG